MQNLQPVSPEGVVQQRDARMSDALVTFQSQLSIVMETILKSAMIEITRLVEDSFLDEVARGKQEVELLLRRLQFSEGKLKEREKRIRCTDCGRPVAGAERTTEKPAETLSGEDALCFRLSLREQSEKRPQFSEVWRSTESLGSYRTTETHSDKEKHNTNVLEKRGTQESTSNTEVQRPQCISAPITRTHDACSNPKPRESHCKTPVMDLNSSKDIELAQSRTIQSATEEDGVGELAPSPSYATVKSEHHPDPVAIKEEEEMLPVWDCGDDCAPAETDQNLAGSWTRDETQTTQIHPENPPTDLVKMCTINRQRTFSMVAREILTQFQVWQRASYSRNIEWGPITAKIISALPYLSGRETEVIVRCTKMLHNRRDYLRRRAKDATLERNSLPMGQRYLLQFHSGNVIQHV